jgi:HEPN domain-containing protein
MPQPAEAARALAALAEVDLQAAEKWLKAVLLRNGQAAPRTHALGALLDGCTSVAPALEALREDAELLTPFAVAPRYVLRSVEEPDLVRRALDAARRFRDLVAPLLAE